MATLGYLQKWVSHLSDFLVDFFSRLPLSPVTGQDTQFTFDR